MDMIFVNKVLLKMLKPWINIFQWKKNRKIWMMFDIESWLCKSEILIFWWLDSEHTLIYPKHVMRKLLKKSIFVVNFFFWFLDFFKKKIFSSHITIFSFFQTFPGTTLPPSSRHDSWPCDLTRKIVCKLKFRSPDDLSRQTTKGNT